MKYSLVGYTGFVGGNLAASHLFDNLYNSSNIRESFGADNGLVVYSGMASEKFLANADPGADYKKAEEAMENIRRMRPQRLVLVSTVDVYPVPAGVDELSLPETEDAPAYGKNRYRLEEWVRQEYPDALILHLPGLFGRGLKKNFIFDLFTLVPSMLTEEKYRELAAEHALVQSSYQPARPGFYSLGNISRQEREQLKQFFAANEFNSLKFTDSRSRFQFYDLGRLWQDTGRALAQGLPLLNLATEPVKAAEVYHFLTGKTFVNELAKPPADYDMRTIHSALFGGQDGYIENKQQVLERIRHFAKEWGSTL